MRWLKILAALVAVVVLAGGGRAQAAVRLCVTVDTSDNPDGLKRLVADELGHHRTHELAEKDCQSQLRVELFGVAGGRFLTARINNEVPVRYAVKNATELSERLSEALRLLLAHDPIYLVEDMSRYNAVQRTALNLLKRGRNRYRLSALEVISATGQNAAFASGAAFEVTRGIDRVQVFTRLWAAGSPSVANVERRVVRFLAGGELGLLFEPSARANTTFYCGPGLGILTMQVEGKNDAGVVSGLKVDAAFSGRIGVRFLRQHNFDFDAFAVGYLPLTNAQDVDSELPKAYTPSLQLGLGVGF